MDEATKQRIFEPFFTTKEVGRGTGLGLATSYSIVKAHNGFIDCVSAPGEGTRFDIYLPVADANSVTVAGQDDPGELRRGDERILIVDDEETLRNLTKDFLENLGYQLETAESAEAALELCSREDHPYRLILMDLGMPGIGGEARAGQIARDRSRDPGAGRLRLYRSPGFCRSASLRGAGLYHQTIQPDPAVAGCQAATR